MTTVSSAPISTIAEDDFSTTREPAESSLFVLSEYSDSADTESGDDVDPYRTPAERSGRSRPASHTSMNPVPATSRLPEVGDTQPVSTLYNMTNQYEGPTTRSRSGGQIELHQSLDLRSVRESKQARVTQLNKTIDVMKASIPISSSKAEKDANAPTEMFHGDRAADTLLARQSQTTPFSAYETLELEPSKLQIEATSMGPAHTKMGDTTEEDQPAATSSHLRSSMLDRERETAGEAAHVHFRSESSVPGSTMLTPSIDHPGRGAAVDINLTSDPVADEAKVGVPTLTSTPDRKGRKRKRSPTDTARSKVYGIDISITRGQKAAKRSVEAAAPLLPRTNSDDIKMSRSARPKTDDLSAEMIRDVVQGRRATVPDSRSRGRRETKETRRTSRRPLHIHTPGLGLAASRDTKKPETRVSGQRTVFPPSIDDGPTGDTQRIPSSDIPSSEYLNGKHITASSQGVAQTADGSILRKRRRSASGSPAQESQLINDPSPASSRKKNDSIFDDSIKSSTLPISGPASTKRARIGDRMNPESSPGRLRYSLRSHTVRSRRSTRVSEDRASHTTRKRPPARHPPDRPALNPTDESIGGQITDSARNDNRSPRAIRAEIREARKNSITLTPDVSVDELPTVAKLDSSTSKRSPAIAVPATSTDDRDLPTIASTKHRGCFKAFNTHRGPSSRADGHSNACDLLDRVKSGRIKANKKRKQTSHRTSATDSRTRMHSARHNDDITINAKHVSCVQPDVTDTASTSVIPVPSPIHVVSDGRLIHDTRYSPSLGNANQSHQPRGEDQPLGRTMEKTFPSSAAEPCVNRVNEASMVPVEETGSALYVERDYPQFSGESSRTGPEIGSNSLDPRTPDELIEPDGQQPVEARETRSRRGPIAESIETNAGRTREVPSIRIEDETGVATTVADECKAPDKPSSAEGIAEVDAARRSELAASVRDDMANTRGTSVSTAGRVMTNHQFLSPSPHIRSEGIDYSVDLSRQARRASSADKPRSTPSEGTYDWPHCSTRSRIGVPQLTHMPASKLVVSNKKRSRQLFDRSDTGTYRAVKSPRVQEGDCDILKRQAWIKSSGSSKVASSLFLPQLTLEEQPMVIPPRPERPKQETVAPEGTLYVPPESSTWRPERLHQASVEDEAPEQPDEGITVAGRASDPAKTYVSRPNSKNAEIGMVCAGPLSKIDEKIRAEAVCREHAETESRDARQRSPDESQVETKENQTPGDSSQSNMAGSNELRRRKATLGGDFYSIDGCTQLSSPQHNFKPASYIRNCEEKVTSTSPGPDQEGNHKLCDYHDKHSDRVDGVDAFEHSTAPPSIAQPLDNQTKPRINLPDNIPESHDRKPRENSGLSKKDASVPPSAYAQSSCNATPAPRIEETPVGIVDEIPFRTFRHRPKRNLTQFIVNNGQAVWQMERGASARRALQQYGSPLRQSAIHDMMVSTTQVKTSRSRIPAAQVTILRVAESTSGRHKLIIASNMNEQPAQYLCGMLSTMKRIVSPASQLTEKLQKWCIEHSSDISRA